ncbi:MAG TPA: PAS domain S-box protein [Candidatus Acidoferrales bacterium]
MPHGYCYLWNPGLVWLNVISDSLIALSYFSIPFALLWFIRKRRDLPFGFIFVLFGLFILACGATHVMEVWNLWHSEYWLAGILKAITALASIATAVFVARLLPQAVEVPSVSKWRAANAALENEIQERRELEISLCSTAANFREQSEMLELIHDAIFVRDFENKVIFWNQSAERLYGWKKDDVRGRTTHDLLQTQFPYDLDLIDAAVLAKGFWEGELKHQTRDGRTVTVSSRWALRRGERGEPIGVLESNRDVTKLKNEEKRFQNLLEAAPDAIVIVNQAGIIQIINAQTEKMFGYLRGELVGMPVEILVPHSVHSKHSNHREAYSHAPQPRSMGAGLHLQGRRKDGTEFPVEISLSPIDTAEGTLISSAIRDVTERKKFELKLKETEQRFRVLVEGIKDYAIIALDPQGTISSWNTGAERIKGYTAGEIIGKHMSSFYRPEDVASNTPGELLRRAADEGVAEQEGWRVRKDGTQFWADVVITALRDDAGQLLGFAKISRDATERRNLEQELRNANEFLEHRVSQRTTELAAANMQLRSRQDEISALNTSLEARVAERTAELVRTNGELEAFSYSVSHDLRTPLRHVDGFARILKEEYVTELPPEGHRFLERILNSTTHMGHLIDDLLNLARIGRKEINRQDTKLSELVKQALSDLRPEEERTIEWRVDALPKLNCDPGLVKLVFTNLLSNASKFTRTRPSAVVEVGSCLTDRAFTLFVRDNGVGFDPKYADKLFGVFQRLHRQEDFEGTGIGLATVQRIIHRHGGRIWAESSPGNGATFYFTLGSQPLAAELPETAEIKHG